MAGLKAVTITDDARQPVAVGPPVIGGTDRVVGVGVPGDG